MIYKIGKKSSCVLERVYFYSSKWILMNRRLKIKAMYIHIYVIIAIGAAIDIYVYSHIFTNLDDGI